MRGDRPVAASDSNLWIKFTPHARGSTMANTSLWTNTAVYPACAGIDLPGDPCGFPFSCLPRMRGDRPLLEFMRESGLQFTPHARGSTRQAYFFRHI